jgi:quercetin dioxygenase-like cupin family protein
MKTEDGRTTLMDTTKSLFTSGDRPLEDVLDAKKNVMKGIRQRSLARGPLMRVDQFFFEAGATAGGHAHNLEELGYIISGEFEMTLGGETKRVTAGDSYSLPAGIRHDIKCLKDGTYVLVKLTTGTPAQDHDHGAHGHKH